MLIHIVVWKYRQDVPEETRAEHVLMLKRLPDLVPGIVSFHVGRDILHLDRSYDTGLTSVFADREALDTYTDHEEHQKVDSMGKQIAEKVASVDFFAE
ncbi:MAG: Dabb family protein [Acidobacteria bacterium]|nr:Dabb family protein [Acidobacteriota bacterium]